MSLEAAVEARPLKLEGYLKNGHQNNRKIIEITYLLFPMSLMRFW